MDCRILRRLENTGIRLCFREHPKLATDWHLRRICFSSHSEKLPAELRSYCCCCQLYYYTVSDKIWTPKMCDLQSTFFPLWFSFEFKSNKMLPCSTRRPTGMWLGLMTSEQLLSICYTFIKPCTPHNHHKRSIIVVSPIYMRAWGQDKFIFLFRVTHLRGNRTRFWTQDSLAPESSLWPSYFAASPGADFNLCLVENDHNI